MRISHGRSVTMMPSPVIATASIASIPAFTANPSHPNPLKRRSRSGLVKRRRKRKQSSTRRTRRKLYWTQQGKCIYCQATMVLHNEELHRAGALRNVRVQVPQDYMTLDHIVPYSTSGSIRAGNLIAACRKCNEERKDGEFLQFFVRARRKRGLCLTMTCFCCSEHHTREIK